MKNRNDNWQRVDAPDRCRGEGADSSAAWLFFVGGGNVWNELRRLAEDRGDRVTSILPSEFYARIHDRECRLHPADAEEMGRIVSHESASASPGSLRIVYLWGLDCAEPGDTDAVALESSLQFACTGFANLVRRLSRLPLENVSLFLVVRGTQSVGRSIGPVSVAQAPLWALAAGARESLPGLRVVQIDLDLAAPRWEARTVFRDMAADRGGDRIAYRDGERYEAISGTVPKEDRSPTEGLPACLQLAVRERGSLEDLVVEPGERVDPGSDEIEIKVSATGLNFRDVLNVMGLFPGDAGPFGIECAGTVARTGPGVEGFAPGDPVMAAITRTGGFRTYAVVPARYVLHRPARLSPAEAATLPVVVITAIHALHDIARIAPGDRILIHSATGGVGLAAVQLAKAAGADIFGTAGNPRKRQYLTSMGIRHVMDSRSLSFADEIMQITSGAGVDIVLNGLTGEFIRKSMSILAPGGRFIEMGKREILQPEAVAAIRDDVDYTAFDLMERAGEEPAFVTGLFQRLDDLLKDEIIHPLPMEVFPLRDVIGAFRFMSKARHIGKVVVIQECDALTRSRASYNRLQADGTYVVAGRLGPEGVDLCRWSVARGARHLVVVVPGDPSSAELRCIEELRQQNVRIRLETVQSHIEADLSKCLIRIGDTQPPVRGVFHHAFGDGMDEGNAKDRETLDAAVAATAGEAWNLHTLTLPIDLDLFVLASRDEEGLDGLVTAGFHEALNRHRIALGLPSEAVRVKPGHTAMSEALDLLLPAEMESHT